MQSEEDVFFFCLVGDSLLGVNDDGCSNWCPSMDLLAPSATTQPYSQLSWDPTVNSNAFSDKSSSTRRVMMLDKGQNSRER